ncbi:MAG: GGDEF domain-containing protein [Acidothermaceae bacterium]
MEPTTLTATAVGTGLAARNTPETAVEALESRLAGQTSELVRLRKNAETGQALLDLHTACTRQRTVVGTARQIAAVASAMTRAPIVVVSVFQAVNQQPLLAVSIGDGVVDEAQIGDVVCDVAAQPDLAWLRTENRLRVVSHETATPSTALLLAELHADRVLITPLFGQGEFVGCIVAKLPQSEPDPDDVAVIEGASALQAHAGDLLHLALVLDELRRRALHDAVTGLPNLAVYEQRLVRALARRSAAQPGHDEVAAILVQVLAMGRITELHGATGVQEVLREIATRLADIAPEHDLGHLGASHFALIAHGEPGAGVDLARAAIEAIEAPMELSFGHVDVHCHAGVSTATDDDAGALLRRAEAASRDARADDVRLVVS